MEGRPVHSYRTDHYFSVLELRKHFLDHLRKQLSVSTTIVGDRIAELRIDRRDIVEIDDQTGLFTICQTPLQSFKAPWSDRTTIMNSSHQLFHVFRRFVSILGVNFEFVEEILDFIFEKPSQCRCRSRLRTSSSRALLLSAW